MLASMAGFIVNDVCVKIASADLPTSQIMGVRGLMATLILLPLAAWRGSLRAPGRMLDKRVALRTGADVMASITYVTALGLLPIANATAIFQALPLVVTVGAAIFLGEAVGWRRWTATAVGFIGVLLIVRPDAQGFTFASTLVLLAVVACAVRDLTTRGIDQTIPTLLIATMTAAANMAIGFGWSLASGSWVPLELHTLGILAFAAIGVACGYVLIVGAMRIGDAGFVAPFRYFMLLYALILGALVFGEFPSALTLVGAAIVVGSGIYTFARERRVGQVQAVRSATSVPS
ncbi:hypothetical protein ASG48_06360 [Aurantimonas sp. Leaf443]|nr:hypothetical protein ASG48_06360 [Aurantimonas sp. Leaf443]